MCALFQPSNQPLQVGQQLEDLREWTLESLQTFPVWQVLSPDGDWFCPFCARMLCFGIDLATHPEQVVDHLANDCDPFETVGSQPIFPESELRRRALGPQIREYRPIMRHTLRKNR